MAASSHIEGPDGYWSEDLLPSRGQYKDIALVALELLGIPKPKSRLEEAREIVEQSATDLHERRLRRQRRSTSGQVARCKGCNVFRSSTVGSCKRCGFDQDTGWAA